MRIHEVSAELDRAIEIYHSSRDLADLQEAVRAFQSARTAMGSGYVPPGMHPRRVAILANHSTQFLSAALEPALASKGLWAEIAEAGYNQWELAALNGASTPLGEHPDFVLLLLSSMEIAGWTRQSPDEIAQRIGAAVDAIRATTGAEIVVTLPEPLPEEACALDAAYEWRVQTIDRIRRSVSAPDVTLIDLDPLIREVGADHWYPGKFYVTSKLAFHPGATKAFADHLARIIRCRVAPICKLILTDLDNVLWAGTVGDEGWDRVDLDAGGRGYPHIRLQHMLKGLRRRGVFLAAVSKNDRETALQVFRQRPEMVLREEDFAGFMINWEPKHRNIARLLENLNLSTAGVIFLDDSAVERDEVRTFLPEIAVPDLADDPAKWPVQLARTGFFLMRAVPPGESDRQALYETESRRQAVRASYASYEDFLRSLKIRMVVEPLEKHRDRVIELVNKTNQFNLTTRRHGWAEIERMLKCGAIGFCCGLEDSHGSYGIISVLLARPCGEGEFLIDTWVMSCRVMGRRVEHAVFVRLAEELRKRDAVRVIGEYIPSSKNSPVKSLYPSLGFQFLRSEGESDFYVLGPPNPTDPNLSHFVAFSD